MNRESTIRFFETRHEREPRGRYYVALGELYRLAGRCTEALALLEAGIAQSPGAVSPRVVRARCLADLGRAEEAVVAWRAVLAGDADHAEARRALAEAATRPPVEQAAPADPPAAATPAEPVAEPVETREPDAAHDEAPSAPPVATEPAVAGPAPLVDTEPDPAPAPATTPMEAAASPSAAKEAAPSPKLNVAPLFQTRTLADIYLGQGHRQKAISILGRILDAHPECADIAEEIAALRRGDDPPQSAAAPAAPPPLSAETQRRNREHFDAWVERTTGRNPT